MASPARTIRLRTWQKNALDAFQASGDPDFLAVATPGAGKTTFALTAAHQDLATHPGRRLVVVAPTQHLKGQWAGAAERLGLHLDPAWITGEPLPPQVHGIVVTYQQVAQGAAAVRQMARDAFAVLDDPKAMEAICEMFAGLLGRPFTADDYLAIGKKTLATERCFNSGAGFGPSSDRLPDFFKNEKLSPHDVSFAVSDEELDQVYEFEA